MNQSTQDLFREDAQLRECSATLLRADERGLLLDRTVFYPLGGGQAGDAGWLRLVDGREIAIADTRKGEGGEILHIPAPDAVLDGLVPGLALTARIDWVRRHAHMRFHTATHLLCALVPHPVDGCSITAGYARLDFHTAEPLDKDALTAGLARLVAGAHAVSHSWISDEELDANPGLVRSMSVQPCAAPAGCGCSRSRTWTCSPAAAPMWRTRPRSAPWSSPRLRRNRPRPAGSCWDLPHERAESSGPGRLHQCAQSAVDLRGAEAGGRARGARLALSRVSGAESQRHDAGAAGRTGLRALGEQQHLPLSGRARRACGLAAGHTARARWWSAGWTGRPPS